MKKNIVNTEDYPRKDWLFGRAPGKIEEQEAEGQQQLVNSEQLPTKVNDPRGANAKELYTDMGIIVQGPSKGDPLFFDVTLPKGWKIKATDHSMWNKLIDDTGRERASIFYKAAFYDRDAFINIE